MLADLRVRLVHCVRANRIDQYLSYQLARVNHAFTCWYGDYKIERIEIDPEDCLGWVREAEEHDEQICRRARELGVPRLEIEYQALCASQDSVLDFLGATRRSLVSRLSKQRKGSQSQIILNYDALKARFAATLWAADFRD